MDGVCIYQKIDWLAVVENNPVFLPGAMTGVTVLHLCQRMVGYGTLQTPRIRA